MVHKLVIVVFHQILRTKYANGDVNIRVEGKLVLQSVNCKYLDSTPGFGVSLGLCSILMLCKQAQVSADSERTKMRCWFF